MSFRGKAIVFGDDINTDYIIAEHYKSRSTDIREIAKYAFADYDPEFMKRMRPGDILVAGRNFGCGSAREAAPHVLKVAGISCVLAVSFARIFFRNAVNIGLPIMECDTTGIEEGDELVVDAQSGAVEDRTRGSNITATPVTGIMAAILEAGGIAGYLRKHGDLVLPPGS
ncbi:MAG TPA: 3-isopropylmalate dehydratase small subunit [Usitatibacter sp.]|nr:3-isopropylmalate dehydratase small subunit [Usitatibacter sp.]